MIEFYIIYVVISAIVLEKVGEIASVWEGAKSSFKKYS